MLRLTPSLHGLIFFFFFPFCGGGGQAENQGIALRGAKLHLYLVFWWICFEVNLFGKENMTSPAKFKKDKEIIAEYDTQVKGRNGFIFISFAIAVLTCNCRSLQ